MVFLSYSSEDFEFVGKLVARLVSARVHIWFDRVELKVGDSLLDRIQDAVSDSDNLVIVLSKASVQSEWCQRELKGAMMKELKEKRVVILPVILEDCDIPLFLQDKLYADFRGNFETGFESLRNALAAEEHLNSGKAKEFEYHHDYAFDWDLSEGRFKLVIDAVSFSQKFPFSIITHIEITGNDAAVRRYQHFTDAGLSDIGALIVLGVMSEMLDQNEFLQYLEQGEVQNTTSIIRDTKSPLELTVTIRSRRLGEPSANDTVFHVGTIFSYVLDSLRPRRPVSHEDNKRIARLLALPIT